MSDMPEQIWYRHTVGAVMVERPSDADASDACYVRQDIHDAALAEIDHLRNDLKLSQGHAKSVSKKLQDAHIEIARLKITARKSALQGSKDDE